MRIHFTLWVVLGALCTFLLSVKASPVSSECLKAPYPQHCDIQSVVSQHRNKRAIYPQTSVISKLQELGQEILPRVVAPSRGGGGGGRRPDDEGGSGSSRTGLGDSDDISGEVSTVGGPTLGRRPPPASDGSVGVAAGDSPIVASTFADAAREAARVSGQTRQQGLDDAIRLNLADNDKGTIESLGYERKDSEQTGEKPLPDFEGRDGSVYLQPFGIDGSSPKSWENRQILNSGVEEGPIVDYSINAEQKVIIIKKAYANENDINRDSKTGLPINGDPSSIMKLKDLMMDNWRVAAAIKKQDVKDLKFIVRDDVVTRDSTQAIDAAFELTGADRTAIATFRSTAMDPKELAAFQEIAGTAHGAGIIQMLADHHIELGDLKVLSWSVFTKQSKSPGYYVIVANTGHV